MLNKVVWLFIISLVLFMQNSHAKTVHKKQFRFTIMIPEGMKLVEDSGAHNGDEMYYDTTAGFVLIISEQQSKMKSVKNYIDCSKQELESMLKASYEDTSLHLLSCNQSPYYPEKINLIIFDLSVLPYGFNRCVVYFVHHRRKDLQFSFMYNKDNAAASMITIDKIMKSLVLE